MFEFLPYDVPKVAWYTIIKNIFNHLSNDNSIRPPFHCEKRDGNCLTCNKTIHFFNTNTNVFTFPVVWTRVREKYPFYKRKWGGKENQNLRQIILGKSIYSIVLLKFNFYNWGRNGISKRMACICVTWLIVIFFFFGHENIR